MVDNFLIQPPLFKETLLSQRRRADFSRGLQFWATCNSQQTADIDKKLHDFVAGNKTSVESLKETEDAIKDLELKRLRLTSEVLKSWYRTTEPRGDAEKKEAVCVDDLVFWQRLMQVSPETYDFLYPRWERFEKLLVSTTLRDHNEAKTERSAQVARLLADDKSKRKQKGEQDETEAKEKE